jgi:hypothetical protein
MKKAKVGQTGTRDTEQLGNLGTPKQGETLTGTSMRPRPEGSATTERIRPPGRPRDSRGPGSYMKALTNIKISIFKENYTEDKLTEDEKDLILKEVSMVICGTEKGKLPHLRSFWLEGGTLICVRGPTVWLVAD